jgi:hypothetical protein
MCLHVQVSRQTQGNVMNLGGRCVLILSAFKRAETSTFWLTHEEMHLLSTRLSRGERLLGICTECFVYAQRQLHSTRGCSQLAQAFGQPSAAQGEQVVISEPSLCSLKSLLVQALGAPSLRLFTRVSGSH